MIAGTEALGCDCHGACDVADTIPAVVAEAVLARGPVPATSLQP